MVAALGSFFCYSTFYCHNGLVLACWLYKLHLAIPFVFFKIFSHCSLPPFPLGNVCNKASDATGATDTNVLTLAHNAGDGNSACLPFRVIISQLQQYCTGVCFKYDTALLLFLGNRNSLTRTLSSTPNLELRSVSACCTVSTYDCVQMASKQRFAKTWQTCTYHSVLKVGSIFMKNWYVKFEPWDCRCLLHHVYSWR